MTSFPSARELVLDRLIDAPRAALYRCWTEPHLLKQWYAPKPWRVTQAEIDPRAGGANNVTMLGPEGQEMPGRGVFLEVVPNEKLVWTDAFAAGWAPGEGPPFMVAIITFANEGGKTRYVARVRHWSADAKKQHEEMGFDKGWGQCADQLEALAKTLGGRRTAPATPVPAGTDDAKT